MEWGGGTNERPGTDHVTSGPMRGLEKNCTRWRRHTNTQTHRNGDSMTNLAQWGRVGENTLLVVMPGKNTYYTFLASIMTSIWKQSKMNPHRWTSGGLSGESPDPLDSL